MVHRPNRATGALLPVRPWDALASADERCEVVRPCQPLCGLSHHADIQSAAPVPCGLGDVGRPATCPDSVPVLAPSSVVPCMELDGNALDLDDRHFVPESRLERSANSIEAEVGTEIGATRYLSCRMNPGIGSPREVSADSTPGEPGKCVLQDTLDRRPPSLPLRSSQSGAIIGDRQLETVLHRHRSGSDLDHELNQDQWRTIASARAELRDASVPTVDIFIAWCHDIEQAIHRRLMIQP